jgi:signal transduction histidine kinase
MVRRIVLVVLGLLAAMLAVVVVPLGLITAQHYRQDFQEQATSSARSLASVAEEKLSDHEPGGRMRAALAELREDGDQVSVAGPAGQRIAGPAVPLAVARAALSSRTPVVRWLDDQLMVTVPVPGDDGGAPVGVVSLSRATGPLSRRVAMLWAWLAAAGLGGLLAGAAASVALARWVSRPLGALEAAARELGSGVLATRSEPADGPGEVRSLAASFNTMAGRLETLVTSHQVMMADVSHQLRTPLAALRLRLDFLAQDADQDMAAEITGAQEEIARLSRLVDGLLAVARAENAIVVPVPVAADQVIRDRTAAWRLAGQDRGVDVTGTCTGPVRARLGDGHLEQVLDNLLANALDAVPSGGHVRVRGTTAGATAVIVVEDDGPGMSEPQRAAAFRRFASATPGGTGLGLAIVHRLVTSNGGQVELSGTPGGGLTVTVTVPRAQPDRAGRRPVVRSS